MDIPVLRLIAIGVAWWLVFWVVAAYADTVTVTVTITDGTATQAATTTATNDAQSVGPAALPALDRFVAGHPNAILSAP
jgi:hypothetical protein